MISTVTRYAALALGAAIAYSGALRAQPPVWETRIGATVTGQALDDVNDGTVNLTFGSMSFPFAGKTYTGTTGANSVLNISSNGFISLGGDNGTGCFNGSCSGDLQQLLAFPFPAIAPFWTDLNPDGAAGGGDVFYNAFNDDSDPEIDRIVITFMTGFADCANDACSALVQVQLLGAGNRYGLPAGTIIFGYNGIVQTASQQSNILVGLSPGNNAADPGNTEFLNSFNTLPLPFSSGTTIYQLFSATAAPASPPSFDLDNTNIVFTPNGANNLDVSNTLANPPASTAPPMWESALGATIRGVASGLDDADDDTVTRTFGTMSFPFAGTTYTGTTGANSVLNISSNGFISLGGDNGTGCPNGDCSGDPFYMLTAAFPTIAPLWTDLEPGPGGGGDIYYHAFNDDGIGGFDRVVITFATGFHDCATSACSELTQLQLLGQGNKYGKPAGTIIFSYNGIRQTNAQLSNILVGLSPGNGAADPGSTDLNANSSFNTVAEPTVYQLFVASSPPPIDLDRATITFQPNGIGGFVVTTLNSGGSAISGGGGGGGCTTQTGRAPDPLFPALLSALALAYTLRRRAAKRPRRHG
jgi:hypothetical protein